MNRRSSANLIDLFRAVGRLQRSDKTFGHQHQEARDVVQRLTAVNLRLWDDWLGLGRTDGADDGQMCLEEEKTKGKKINYISGFNQKAVNQNNEIYTWSNFLPSPSLCHLKFY